MDRVDRAVEQSCLKRGKELCRVVTIITIIKYIFLISYLYTIDGAREM